MKRIFAISVICALALPLAAPAAFAQDPTRETYDVRGLEPESLSAIEVLSETDSSDESPAAAPASEPASSEVATSSAEALPFTGLDVGILALLGVALVGTGLVMRRVARGSHA